MKGGGAAGGAGGAVALVVMGLCILAEQGVSALCFGCPTKGLVLISIRSVG